MNFQQLYYVKIMAETKSINKAAKLSHVSQPALTRQLRLLENELATTLFKRSNNGIKLTKEGEYFVNEAEKILNQVDSLKQRFIEREKKLLQIAALPSIATHLLPGIIKKVNNLGYKTNILILDTSDQIDSLLLEGKIDVGFVQDVEKMNYAYPILIEPYYLIVPNSSRLSSSQAISLSELTNENIILPLLSCDIRKSFDNYLNQQGIVIKNIMEVGENESILSLVKNGIGLTILPEMSINDLNNVKFIPLKNKEFTRRISLLTYSKKLVNLLLR